MSKKCCLKKDLNSESRNIPEIFELIDKVAKSFDKIQRHFVQQVKLTPSQYFILRQLKETNGVAFKDLATACCCARPTITGIVDSLEKKGLVVRDSNPGDRRSLLVKLTDQGKTIETEIPSLNSIFGNCCSNMSEDELSQLKILLQKLLDSINL
jgi:DNA-binding MarR family transcriptional regulator